MSRGARSARPIASDLLEAGWLPRRAAAAAMGISVSELDERVADGIVKVKSIGPGARLYEVVR